MYPICSFRNADFRELLDEHKLTKREFLLNSVYLVLTHQSYNARSGCRGTNSHYDASNLKRMVNELSLCKWVMWTGAHVHLFCSASRSRPRYKRRSEATEEEEKSESNNRDGSAADYGEGKKKAVLEVESVPLPYT